MPMELCKLLRTPIYFKIVTFFNENPTSIDTPRGISAWVGENRKAVNAALLKLAKLKILTAHKVTSTTGYSYTIDPKKVRAINNALKKLKKEE